MLFLCVCWNIFCCCLFLLSFSLDMISQVLFWWISCFYLSTQPLYKHASLCQAIVFRGMQDVVFFVSVLKKHSWSSFILSLKSMWVDVTCHSFLGNHNISYRKPCLLHHSVLVWLLSHFREKDGLGMVYHFSMWFLIFSDSSAYWIHFVFSISWFLNNILHKMLLVCSDMEIFAGRLLYLELIYSEMGNVLLEDCCI